MQKILPRVSPSRRKLGGRREDRVEVGTGSDGEVGAGAGDEDNGDGSGIDGHIRAMAERKELSIRRGKGESRKGRLGVGC